jgi:hypothetical protein
MPLSNNAQIADHDSIQYKTYNRTPQVHNDEKIMIQLFKHLHRPLPEYHRPNQLGTKESFYIQSKDILLTK